MYYIVGNGFSIGNGWRCMLKQVFDDFMKAQIEFGDLTVLDTPTFVEGMTVRSISFIAPIYHEELRPLVMLQMIGGSRDFN